MFNDLLNAEISNLIADKPKSYHTLIRKNKNYLYLLNYIEENTKLLEDPKYKFVTKVFWVLHKIESFDDPLLHCRECGKLISDNPRFKMRGYGEFCSLQCCNKNSWHHENCKRTSIEHFGEDNYMNRRKAEETSLEKFGSKHFMGTKEFYEKSKVTLSANYGITNPMQSQKFIDKIAETKKLRYDDPHYVNVEKAKETQYERYGMLYVNTNQYKNSTNETNLSKYGVKWYVQSEDFKEKNRETCNERYGADYYAQSEFFKNEKKRYSYDNTYFDSLPELMYYFWLKNNKHEFTFHPEIVFYFKDDFGKMHGYHPDFLVENKYIEIKGAHFFNSNGEMICPWKNKNWTEEKIKETNRLYRLKQLCMIENNVKILLDTSEEFEEIRKFFNDNVCQYSII